jgi:ribulose 1,5-bisphosphate carboxylase large subunit-like protein
MARTGYIDLNYLPVESDLLATFYVEPGENLILSKASEAIAAESSIGTWTEITTTKPGIMERLGPTVYEMDAKTGIVKISMRSLRAWQYAPDIQQHRREYLRDEVCRQSAPA